MSKEGDIKFLKIQTCVLKVNIHCDGCKQKVKKLLQKIDGVYTTTIDAEQGRVTVTGNVDPAALIKKLAKNGKLAELLAPKLNSSNNNNNQQQQQSNNQFQKFQLENAKGGQIDGNGGKAGAPKGRGGGNGNNNQKGQPQTAIKQPFPPQLQPQMNGINLSQLKDLKMQQQMPFMKDPRSVKFNIPEDDEGSDLDDDFDDEFDDDDDDLDNMDGFNIDFVEELKQIKNGKPMNGMPIGNDKKGGGGGKGKPGGGCGGGGSGDVIIHHNGVVRGGDDKNGNSNGKKGGGGCGVVNQNPAGNDGKKGVGQDGKNGGNNNNNKIAPNENPNNNQGAKKGGKNEMIVGNNQHPAMAMVGARPAGMNMMPLQMGGVGAGNMSMHPMAVHGLHASGGPRPEYFNGGPAMTMPLPEVIAATNPYQQQNYLAAMMQQQRMMMNDPDRSFQPMVYARPPVPVNYMPPPPPEYTHFFSDENTSSCSIM